MIQPISTLRDHPNVFKLPGSKKEEKPVSPLNLEDDPQDQVNEAYQGVQQALEASRTKNLNDFLLDDPEKPEIDEQKVQQNKKAAKIGLILQAIDSIGSLAGGGGEGADPVVNPARFDQIGLSALNNLNNLDQQQQVDLRNYNRSKSQVDRMNQELKLNLANQQDRTNLQTAQVGLEQAKFNLQQELSEEERERLDNDKQAAQNLQIGLELASRGHTDQAREFFEDSGLEEEKYESFISAAKKDKEKRLAEARRELEKENRQFVGVPDELKGFGVDRTDIASYKRYQDFAKNASDEDYPIDKDAVGTTENVRDYSKGPKRGTPSWHMQNIEENLGNKLYLIQDVMGTGQNTRPQTEGTIRRPSEPISGVLRTEFQPFNNEVEAQSTLAESNALADKIRQGNATEKDVEKWQQNVTRIAHHMGKEDDEIQREIAKKLDEFGASSPEEPTENEYAGQSEGTKQESKEGFQVTQAGMGSVSPQKERELRGVAETLFGPVGGAIAENIPKLKGLNTDQIYGIAKGIYNQFKKAGVQIRSREEERLQEMYGDEWKSLIEQMKSENPNVSEDYLRYLLIEAPNSELIPEGNG